VKIISVGWNCHKDSPKIGDIIIPAVEEEKIAVIPGRKRGYLTRVFFDGFFWKAHTSVQFVQNGPELICFLETTPLDREVIKVKKVASSWIMGELIPIQ